MASWPGQGSSVVRTARGRWRAGSLALLALLAAIVSGVVLVGPAATPAAAYSDKVNRHCERDYKRLCKQYLLYTKRLSRCMEAKRSSISKRCIDALVDSGAVPRKYRKK